MKSVIILSTLVYIASATVVRKWHRSDNGALYFIEPEQKFNWFEAWNECARKNMSLIAIDRYEGHYQIDSLIRKLFTTCPSFWLAGNDNAVDGRYEWATTGEIFTFTNWGSGQPGRTTGEHCILLWTTWDWHDLTCTHKLGFICEENRAVKEKCKGKDSDDYMGFGKTFIWRNYNGNVN
ncbi:lectin subunit alpha [Stomoxys calcitrans]|uniref:C-type lectin domain-containing protein n=1 Tax=Stomoxys calcitrans TaxID=35570 RepID=A0A1I8Q071_STOCA|nr:lectin subunit alpha [Stomoxys calcitrans]